MFDDVRGSAVDYKRLDSGGVRIGSSLRCGGNDSHVHKKIRFMKRVVDG